MKFQIQEHRLPVPNRAAPADKTHHLAAGATPYHHVNSVAAQGQMLSSLPKNAALNWPTAGPPHASRASRAKLRGFFAKNGFVPEQEPEHDEGESHPFASASAALRLLR